MACVESDVEPWEWQYLENLEGWDNLAWTDRDAINRYIWAFPKIYDKVTLTKSCTPFIVKKPGQYPIIFKPGLSLDGMGKGAVKIFSQQHLIETIGDLALDSKSLSSYVWQPYYEGDHFSIDLAINNSIIKDWFCFVGHKDDICRAPAKKIVKKLGIDRGVLNLEFIGANVIEGHLRPSIQFFDIGGYFYERLPQFMDTGKMEPRCVKEKTYSVVYRTDINKIPISIKKIPPRPKGVRSVQLTFEEGKPLSAQVNDEYSYRYMVINGTCRYIISKYAEQVEKCIKWDTV